jgi:L-ascorbate metabolism protein UlaG (beta-lactamase superfamily)
MYSANYLFRSKGVRWAVDPLSLHWRIPAALRVDLAADLADLKIILLTHDHKDHLDLELIKALKELPIQWVVPQFLVEKIHRETKLSMEKMIFPKLMHPLNLQGLTILPFEGQHLITNPDGTCKGVPELGYLVESAGRRWLFPGDTRVYDLSRFPKFGSVDILFAHLWLGHGTALMENVAMSETFCRFFADLKPKRIFITHLEEFGRDANDFFDEGHAQRVKQIFETGYAAIACETLMMGEKIVL